MTMPKQIAPLVATIIDPCPQCGERAVQTVQWVEQTSVIIGTNGSGRQRVAFSYTICFWCLRREHFEMDADSVGTGRSVAVIPGQGMAGALGSGLKEMEEEV